MATDDKTTKKAAASASSNLNIIAAAAEQIRTADAAEGSASMTAKDANSSPSDQQQQPRAKLVLPKLTPEIAQDIALTKTLRTGKIGSPVEKPAKPYSIGTRPEFADYPLSGISTPHPNDVCKCANPVAIVCSRLDAIEAGHTPFLTS